MDLAEEGHREVGAVLSEQGEGRPLETKPETRAVGRRSVCKLDVEDLAEVRLVGVARGNGGGSVIEDVVEDLVLQRIISLTCRENFPCATEERVVGHVNPHPEPHGLQQVEAFRQPPVPVPQRAIRATDIYLLVHSETHHA
jgi:hypothetical protein